jgi:hypothetical protein
LEEPKVSTPNVDLAIKLFELGWKLFPTVAETIARITPDQLEMLKALYAAFHALSSAKDTEDMQEPRFCALPDVMEARTSLCKWPSNHITWTVQAAPPGLSVQQVAEAGQEAFRRWSEVCGLTAEYQPGNANVMIAMGTRRIDGTFGVLAESELPCGQVRQCRQWYDSSEQWGLFDDRGPGGNAIDLIRVMTHELGHALGMNHIGAGNLLAPTYSPTIIKPQAGDIKEMQARYGTPSENPPPPPPPPAGGNAYILRIQDGVLSVDGFRLTKLLEKAA